MSNRFLTPIVVILAIAFPIIQQVYSAPQTFAGTVSDAMCVNKHMMPGKSDAECVQTCVKYGSDYVLVSGKKVFALGAKPQELASYAGKRVVVEGSLEGTKIAVSSIQAAK